MDEHLDKNHAMASIRRSWGAVTHSGEMALVLDLVPTGEIGVVVDQSAISLLRETLAQIEDALSAQKD